MPSIPNRKIFFILLICSILSFASVCFAVYNHINQKNKAELSEKTEVKAKASRATLRINEHQIFIENRVKNLSIEMGREKIPEKNLRGEFSGILKKEPVIREFGVYFAPDSTDENEDNRNDRGENLYAPHSEVSDKGVIKFSTDVDYNYTEKNWYREAFSRGPSWSSPYYNDETKEMLIEYTAPFYVMDSSDVKRPGGVIRCSVSLENLRDLMFSLDLGKSGFSYLCDKNGIFIYHPVHENVKKGYTIQKVVDSIKNPLFTAASQKALNGERGFVDFVDPQSKKRFWIFYEPVPASGWILSVVYPQGDSAAELKTAKRQKIVIVMLGITFLAFLVFLICFAYGLNRTNLWIASVSLTILCALGTCFVWYQTTSYSVLNDETKKIISDKTSLNKFMADQTRHMLSDYHGKPFFVPTGLSIQNIEFISSNNINITGILWQRYTIGLHDELSRGFEMPEAKQIVSRQAFYERRGNTEVIGWYFTANIREFFDYSQYPFDRPDIWIWIRHKDIDRNVILVPDLNSYRYTAPSACPGLEENIFLPGYTIMGTFFSYNDMANNASYGLSNRSGKMVYPEFYFNIIMKRNFSNPFVTKILPLLIIWAILFIVLLMLSHDEVVQKRGSDGKNPSPDSCGDEEKKEESALIKEDKGTRVFGVSGITFIGTIITFFFTTLLAQINLRSELTPDRLLFLENFYIIVYIVLLMVSINGFLYFENRNIKVIQHDSNLIPKLFYWPAISLMILIVSLLNFY